MILAKKWSLSWMNFEVIIHVIKNLSLHNVDILEKLLKDQALNKKYIAEKDDFEMTLWDL